MALECLGSLALAALLGSSPISSPVPCPAFDLPAPQEGQFIPDVIRIKIGGEWKPCLVSLTSAGLTWMGDPYPHPVLVLTDEYHLLWQESVFHLGDMVPEGGVPGYYYTTNVTEDDVTALFAHLESISAFEDVGEADFGISSGMRYADMMIHEGDRRIRLHSTWACSPTGSFHGEKHWGPIPEGMTFEDLMAREPKPMENARRHFVFAEAHSALLSLIPERDEWQTTTEFLGHGYSRGICTNEQLTDAAERRASAANSPDDEGQP